MYGFKILCKISKGTFEISCKILDPYTAKYVFYCLLFLLVSYDIFELWRYQPFSETGPRRHAAMCQNSGAMLFRGELPKRIWFWIEFDVVVFCHRQVDVPATHARTAPPARPPEHFSSNANAPKDTRDDTAKVRVLTQQTYYAIMTSLLRQNDVIVT